MQPARHPQFIYHPLNPPYDGLSRLVTGYAVPHLVRDLVGRSVAWLAHDRTSCEAARYIALSHDKHDAGRHHGENGGSHHGSRIAG